MAIRILINDYSFIKGRVSVIKNKSKNKSKKKKKKKKRTTYAHCVNFFKRTIRNQQEQALIRTNKTRTQQCSTTPLPLF